MCGNGLWLPVQNGSSHIWFSLASCFNCVALVIFIHADIWIKTAADCSSIITSHYARGSFLFATGTLFCLCFQESHDASGDWISADKLQVTAEWLSGICLQSSACTFRLNTSIFEPRMIIQSDLAAQSPAGTVQMPCQQCSCWQRFREPPWYAAIWHGRPIRKVLPTCLKSVLTCGCRFPWRDCDDSDLIIIKSTCMTGCGPLMGLLFSSDPQTGAWWEVWRCCDGGGGLEHVSCLFV